MGNVRHARSADLLPSQRLFRVVPVCPACPLNAGELRQTLVTVSKMCQQTRVVRACPVWSRAAPGPCRGQGARTNAGALRWATFRSHRARIPTPREVDIRRRQDPGSGGPLTASLAISTDKTLSLDGSSNRRSRSCQSESTGTRPAACDGTLSRLKATVALCWLGTSWNQ